MGKGTVYKILKKCKRKYGPYSHTTDRDPKTGYKRYIVKRTCKNIKLKDARNKTEGLYK